MQITLQISKGEGRYSIVHSSYGIFAIWSSSPVFATPLLCKQNASGLSEYQSESSQSFSQAILVNQLAFEIGLLHKEFTLRDTGRISERKWVKGLCVL